MAAFTVDPNDLGIWPGNHIPGVFLFANLPIIANLRVGVEAFASDIGPNGSPVFWNGASWNIIGGVAGSSSPGGAANGLSNFTAQNTINIRGMVAAVRSGAPATTAGTKIGWIGDSTTAGAWSNGTVITNARIKAVVSQLANQLTARGIPSQADSWWGDAGITGSTVPNYDPRISLPVAGFAPFGSTTTIGGHMMSATTNGAKLAFTPVTAFDTIDIFYLVGTTQGSFTVDVDGGAILQTVNSNGFNFPYRKVTITGVALATHTINITTTSASAIGIFGIAVRDSTTPRLELYNYGVSSATMASYTAAGTLGTGAAVAIPQVGATVHIINLTINDTNNFVLGNSLSAAVAAYSALYQSLITTCMALGDVILMIGNPGAPANFLNGVNTAYNNAVYALAAANNLPLVDITQRWVSFLVTTAVMKYGDSGNFALHPGPAGYSDIAEAVSLLFPL